MSTNPIQPSVTETKVETQFTIPPPYRAWCHHCNKGFISIEELQEHTLTLRIWKG
jgi:hypothetical protein